MTLAELEQQYGKAVINLEIWQNKAMELKRAIAEEMNKAMAPKQEEPPK